MVYMPLFVLEYSFNRYMVECEYVSRSIAFNVYDVLIDTWWNVN